MKTCDKLKLVNSAFDSLRWAFDSCNVNHADTLLEMCKSEEKGHRGWGDDFKKYHPDAPSVPQIAKLFAAKLFAVKRVAEYLNGAKAPGGSDYLHTQKSCFQASAMVAEFAARIKGEWIALANKREESASHMIGELAALDYCEFVKAQDPKAEFVY